PCRSGRPRRGRAARTGRWASTRSARSSPRPPALGPQPPLLPNWRSFTALGRKWNAGMAGPGPVGQRRSFTALGRKWNAGMIRPGPVGQLAFVYRPGAVMERRNGRAGPGRATGVRLPPWSGKGTPVWWGGVRAAGGGRRAAGGGRRRSGPLSVEQVLGGLAGLPVLVGERRLQGGVDGRALEGGQGEDGPAADGRLVGAGGQHGVEPAGVADRPERRHRRLPDQRVAMSGGGRGEVGDGAAVPHLTQRPGRGLGDGGVAVAEQFDEHLHDPAFLGNRGCS